MLRVSAEAFRSDVGRQRNANEDSFFSGAPVFAVADGMGGAQAGEVASSLAVEEFASGSAHEGDPGENRLAEIVRAANARIYAVASEDSSRSGMGTTLTAAALDGDDLAIAHVGDSRAYLYRDGQLRQLTNDHSLVEEMRRQGQLTREEAEEHPQRSVILRALGVEPDVEIDTMSVRLRPGDTVLLCTDGLTTMLADDDVAGILATTPDLGEAAERMISAANEAGGRDNITVGIFRVEGAGEPAEEGATLVSPASAGGISAADVEAEIERTGARRGPAAPRASTPAGPGSRRRRRVLKLLAALALLAAVAVGVRAAVSGVYFLGTDEGGRIAIYKGLPYELPLGIDLYEEYYSSPVRSSSVPQERRGSLTDHEWRSREDAIDLVTDLERSAQRLREQELERLAPKPAADRRRAGPASDRANGGNR